MSNIVDKQLIFQSCKIDVTNIELPRTNRELSSLAQRIYSNAKTIFSRTINPFKKLFYSIYDGGKVGNIEGKENSPSYPLLHRLHHMKSLGTGIIQLLANEVETSKIASKVVVNWKKEGIQFLQNQQITTMIIPLIIKGGFFKRGLYSRNHITTLIIDKTARKVLFVDPTGRSLRYYRKARIAPLQKGMPAEEKIKTLWKNIVDNLPNQNETWEFSENIRCYQNDAYNCGVHFYQMAESYAKDGKFSPVLDTLKKIREQRKKIIDIIKKIDSLNTLDGKYSIQ